MLKYTSELEKEINLLIKWIETDRTKQDPDLDSYLSKAYKIRQIAEQSRLKYFEAQRKVS